MIRISGSQILAIVSILLIAPGMFFYGLALNQGIPSLPIGYFGAAVIVASLSSILALVREFGNPVPQLGTLGFVIFGAALFQLIIFSASFSSAEYKQSAANVLLGQIIYFSLIPVGAASVLIIEKYKLTLRFSLLFVFCCVITFTHLGTFDFYIQKQYASHQYFGFALLFISVLCIITAKLLECLFFLLLSSIAIFLIGARSEIILYAIIFFAWLYISLQDKKGQVILFSAMILLILVYLLSQSAIVNFLEGATNNRFLHLFENRLASGSLTERYYANSNAWDSITSSIILGQFASYPPGMYAHNMLSMWVDFGLLGLLIHLSVYFFAFATIRRLRTERWKSTLLYSLLFGVFILEITVKSYSYPLTALVFGIILGFCLQQRHFKNTFEVKLLCVTH